MASLKIADELNKLIKKIAWQMVYPVGTYYETSNTGFDPNKEWGGTWVQDTKGKVMVSKADSGVFEVMGGDYGQASVNLSHYHTPGGVLTACIGSPTGNANALGFAATNAEGPDSTYSVGNSPSPYTHGHPGRSHNTIITGRTESALGLLQTVQPSKVCIRWHRTK